MIHVRTLYVGRVIDWLRDNRPLESSKRTSPSIFLFGLGSGMKKAVASRVRQFAGCFSWLKLYQYLLSNMENLQKFSSIMCTITSNKYMRLGNDKCILSTAIGAEGRLYANKKPKTEGNINKNTESAPPPLSPPTSGLS